MSALTVYSGFVFVSSSKNNVLKILAKPIDYSRKVIALCLFSEQYIALENITVYHGKQAKIKKLRKSSITLKLIMLVRRSHAT